MSYKHCIINFSDKNGNFQKGQQRLVSSLNKVGYVGDVLTFTSHEQLPGCRPHREVPYGFKMFAIDHARQKGYDVVLYLDASIWPIKHVMPCLNYIHEQGHLFEMTGFSLGQWTNDYALNKFGISREEALKVLMFSAGFTGLNLRNPVTAEFFEKWFQYAKEGDTFRGDWANHRHDQCSGSFLAHQMGMKVTEPKFMNYYFGDDSQIKPETIFLAQGI